jgi:hypothetical protein
MFQQELGSCTRAVKEVAFVGSLQLVMAERADLHTSILLEYSPAKGNTAANICIKIR